MDMAVKAGRPRAIENGKKCAFVLPEDYIELLDTEATRTGIPGWNRSDQLRSILGERFGKIRGSHPMEPPRRARR